MNRAVRLGVRANAGQFALLVALNGVVGAMVGLERTVLPLLGERDFDVASRAAILSFVVAFGAAKALANLAAGRFAASAGRRRMLIIGWLLAVPVAPLVAFAPSWSWIVVANLFLGASQGVAWSLTVFMKIDLAGPRRRGLALGANESAGYLGLATAALATGALAGSFAPRTVVWVGAAGLTAVGLAASIVFVRDTAAHVRLEERDSERPPRRPGILVACAQAGFVTNLNDALAWGLAPLYLATNGASVGEIGAVAAVYPAVWGTGQVASGWFSDRSGRRPLIVAGMLTQAGGLAVLVAGGGTFTSALAAAALLGAGTALVYPTLMAEVADAVETERRTSAVGTYRFWRDSGLVAGALLVGALADFLGSGVAIGAVAAITAASGLWIASVRWPARHGRRLRSALATGDGGAYVSLR